MQKEGYEEQHRGDEGGSPDRDWAPYRVDGVKMCSEGKCNQEGDDEPAVMQADFDSANTSELDLGSHEKTAFVVKLDAREPPESDRESRGAQRWSAEAIDVVSVGYVDFILNPFDASASWAMSSFP